jgi:hypothetical protein
MWPRRFASTFTASRTKKPPLKRKLRRISRRRTLRQELPGCVRLLRQPRQRPLLRLRLRLLLLRLSHRHLRWHRLQSRRYRLRLLRLQLLRLLLHQLPLLLRPLLQLRLRRLPQFNLLRRHQLQRLRRRVRRLRLQHPLRRPHPQLRLRHPLRDLCHNPAHLCDRKESRPKVHHARERRMLGQVVHDLRRAVHDLRIRNNRDDRLRANR